MTTTYRVFWCKKDAVSLGDPTSVEKQVWHHRKVPNNLSNSRTSSVLPRSGNNS